MFQLDDIIREVRGKLQESRFQHSWQVAVLAKELAPKYNICAERAFIAGLLHDYGRAMDTSQLLDKARSAGLSIHPVEEKLPMLLHGPVGALLVEELFGIDDMEVLAAIAYHTTGRAGMSPIEKLIYLVDVIEPGRQFPCVDQLRNRIEQANSLNEAMELVLIQALLYNIKKNSLIHPQSIDALNCLRSTMYDIV